MSSVGTDPDVPALLERIAALERQAMLSAPVPINTYRPPEFVPKTYTTTSIGSLLGSDLPHNLRDFWRLYAAVALARGEPVVVGKDIPTEYPPLMRRVYAARLKRASWREALNSAGLTVPDNARLAELAREVHADATSGTLWDGLLPAASAVKARAGTTIASKTFETLRNLMT